MTEPLWTNSEWTFPLIEKVWGEIEKIAIGELNLSYYEPQIEILSSDQMLDIYTSIGMPIYYQHWSFGKQFIREQKNYQSGRNGLAYELVINSRPSIAYLMEDNTMTMQALVLAHASAGHSHFFKNNYLFKQWTDASSIIDYLIFSREYIHSQEAKHGKDIVEKWIDSCHALMDYGVNRYKRPSKLNMEKEKQRQQERANYLQSQVTELYTILPKKKNTEEDKKDFPKQPEENLLYFFEKYAPDLEDWQREILRIVRKMAQYYMPQSFTKTMNEGVASMVHYKILNRMHEKGLTTDGAHLEFLTSHCGVLYQPPFDSKYYSGLNPYAFGFAILRDIERMCVSPTEEDLRWFPQVKGANGWEIILDSIENYRDESFIRQWLSPKVIRDFQLFSVYDDREDDKKYIVSSIHNDQGYHKIKEKLANSYLRSQQIPELEIIKVDRKTKLLTIKYTEVMGRKLDNASKMITHLSKLWGGYPVNIIDGSGNIIVSST